MEIEGKGAYPRDGFYTTAVSFKFQCLYGNGVVMDVANNHRKGVLFQGTEGSIFVSRKVLESEPKSIVRSKIGPNEEHLYESKGHWTNFLECVRERKEPVASVEIAHRSVSTCHLANICMLLDRKLKWDPELEQCINDPEANRMLHRPMREPWHL